MLWQEKPCQSWETRLFCICLLLDWKLWFPCKVASLSAPSDWAHPVVCNSMTATNCKTMPLKWVWPAFSLRCFVIDVCNFIMTAVLVDCLVIFCSVPLANGFSYFNLTFWNVVTCSKSNVHWLLFLNCQIWAPQQDKKKEKKEATLFKLNNYSYGHICWHALFATHEALNLQSMIDFTWLLFTYHSCQLFLRMTRFKSFT